MDCNEKERNTFKPISENPIILDFTGCKNIYDVHHLLKKQFDFPDYYGENLSALWDCLRDYFGYHFHVEIKGLNSLPYELYEYMVKIMKVFDRV
ncbi:MAG: barstar family protein, partial [Bacillota bacterium]|nr:barstar family protein [Bacillota bacterium]